MVKWLVSLALVAGCFDDRYRCTHDAQCNVEGGRCELDRYCTKPDDGCPSGRRYQHAGEHGNACFDDRIAPSNLCAPGQPPAKPGDDCIAEICERLPACCSLGWTDACVQLAQQLCDGLRCETRIAIVAATDENLEVWDLRWLADGWQVPVHRSDLTALQWVGPAPGDFFPRPALTTNAGELVVGEIALPTTAGRTYAAITTVNFDRDRRDTIAIAHNDGTNSDHTIDFFKPPTLVPRSVPVPASLGLSWGDLDRDRYPDAVTRANAQYHYSYNRDGASQGVRTLSPQTMAMVQGGSTPPSPNIQSFDWFDFDGDKRLDLVVFGSEVRIHTADEIRDGAEHEIDCEPPAEFLRRVRPAPCAGPNPTYELVAFAGAALPSVEEPSIVISTYPHRRIQRWFMKDGVVGPPQTLFDGCRCSCPTCTGNLRDFDCAACLPFLAIVTRDLDGDQALDIVAIDARLNVYHALAPNFELVGPLSLPTTLGDPEGFFQIQTSVTGVPIP